MALLSRVILGCEVLTFRSTAWKERALRAVEIDSERLLNGEHFVECCEYVRPT